MRAFIGISRWWMHGPVRHLPQCQGSHLMNLLSETAEILQNATVMCLKLQKPSGIAESEIFEIGFSTTASVCLL